MRVVIVMLGLMATDVLADPKPKISPADQRTCHDRLRTGRELAGNKSYAKAVAAFDECLKVVPDEATVLAERGFAAYLAKDYKLAETSTRKAIANQSEPSLLGAAAYNLGLILEAKGDRAAAIVAYTTSLRARPHSVVRAALKKLDPVAAAKLDPFAPKLMAGPFASVEAYCKSVDRSDDAFACTCGKAGPTAAILGYKEVAGIDLHCKKTTMGSMAASETLALGVRVDKGWYVADAGEYHENLWCIGGPKVEKLHGEDVVPGGAVEILVDLSAQGSCTGGESMRDDEWSSKSLVVIGLGKAGAPHATPEIMLVRRETHADQARPEHVVTDVKLTAKWQGGALVLAGSTKGLDAPEAANVVGSHAIVFP